MPVTISNNSAVASASYYLDKNQQALQMTIKRLASGKRIVSPNEDPGTLSVTMKLNAAVNRLSGAKNNVQNGISFVEVQDGVLETVGRIVGPYGGTQGHGHAGSNEEFAGCTVVQQRICGSAETIARCLGSDLQWGQSVRGFCDWPTEKSPVHKQFPWEHLGGQLYYRDLHRQRRVLWYQDKSVQVRGAFGLTVDASDPAESIHISRQQRECLWIIRKRYRRNYLPRRVRTVDGSVRTGIIKCRFFVLKPVVEYPAPGFRSGQHLFDGDQSAFGNRTDRGCRYRRRECEPGEVFDSNSKRRRLRWWLRPIRPAISP